MFRCFQYAEAVVSYFNLRGQQARNFGESYQPLKKKEINYYHTITTFAKKMNFQYGMKVLAG